jgi:hypothetical protein
LTESSKIRISDYFEVSNTEELRETFAWTHQKMSASLPIEDQFGTEEQRTMMLACRELPVKGATQADIDARESDLCELLHYLVMNGVPVVEIDKQIRLFSSYTKKVTMQLGYQQRVATRQEEDRRAATPLFLAPEVRVLEEAMA